MDFSGEYTIPAPREQVWEALNDAGILQRCIPGAEQVDKLSDTEFKARVKAKVGPVQARFSGQVQLTDLDPPNSYTISGSGQGGAAGMAKGSAHVHLSDAANGATTLRYQAHAEVGGKLASVGSRLVQGVAAQYAEDFFGRFSRIVGGEEEPAPAAAVHDQAQAAATATAGAPVDPNWQYSKFPDVPRQVNPIYAVGLGVVAYIGLAFLILIS